MAVADELQVARDLVAGQEKPRPKVAEVNPVVRTPKGGQLNAAEIVFGLARELNTDKVELPGFPDVVARLQRALADEGTAAKDVVRLVHSEPALAARLLQMANSVAFNRSGRDISDLRAAISNLGFNIVRSQAAAFAMRQMEKQEWLQPIRPVLADIWKTSNGVAAISFGVARRVSGVKADEAMATGLFHLIGKLYLFARARQESIEPKQIADWESALHDWHATIARTILDHWKIPTPVAEAVEMQNGVFTSAIGDLSPLTRILNGAKLYERIRAPGAAPEPAAEDALGRIMFGEQSFEALAVAAEADIAAVRRTFGT